MCPHHNGLVTWDPPTGCGTMHCRRLPGVCKNYTRADYRVRQCFANEQPMPCFVELQGTDALARMEALMRANPLELAPIPPMTAGAWSFDNVGLAQFALPRMAQGIIF
jgi:hypothetical protein